MHVHFPHGLRGCETTLQFFIGGRPSGWTLARCRLLCSCCEFLWSRDLVHKSFETVIATAAGVVSITSIQSARRGVNVGLMLSTMNIVQERERFNDVHMLAGNLQYQRDILSLGIVILR